MYYFKNTMNTLNSTLSELTNSVYICNGLNVFWGGPLVYLYMKSKFVTNRQTNSLTPYMGGYGFFLQVKFATSLLTSLAGG